ncbi:glycosyltransferase N-terminal domain-containing protein [Aliiglaciecola sp. 2_MG-2023]|uniref:3-deoxy-D-manno-octulosonic acid transferase n=1 Tax=unclassified Aliiglaciecola TaxID=2593648 RepID=UPI0026E26881|nr:MULTISPECIES: glycosyltransferase N-terminal domain-containing protein [unclassified Aliiglaciecola]MDO6709195.1 glycosyltransferase N-terminal domain-containing protein [Aliiglaciecola sp. 2_MG-2023]MDO6750343.1 glycosyltransferase N-terminal domain-containing protein [Aliiglaciecola sp. 1_MG-2023]
MELIKWWFYSLILSVIGEKQNPLIFTQPDNQSKDSQKPFIWIFCSTIGELNGCKPVIDTLAKDYSLVLISDRDCYAEAYRVQFPEAHIVQLTGWKNEAKSLYKLFPTKHFILCEIPCMPNDAPCRLAYAFLRFLKKQNTTLIAVNSWLYEYAPSCKQDVIERRLFAKEYVQLFDSFMVQTDSVKAKLSTVGASESKIYVTGNLKFDAVSDLKVQFKDDHAKSLFTQLNSLDNPIFVAGSLSDKNEYLALIDAFIALKKNSPSALMIMAPRHPEKQQQLDEIAELLAHKNLRFQFRSQIENRMSPALDVLVLDTFGELRGLYSVSDFSYIGKNHNVLEPLAFGKPVVVVNGWESTYPSYPVYEISKQHNLLFEVNNTNSLGEELIKVSQLDLNTFGEQTKSTLTNLATTLSKNISIMRELKII